MSGIKLRGDVLIQRNQYLAGFMGVDYPTIPRSGESTKPPRAGTIDDFAEKYPDLVPTLYNDVKTCPKCEKPCAFNMMVCNSCGENLEQVPVGQSENVFSAFLFGIASAKKGFPYQISLRRQTRDVMVFDDMLALTPVHMNGISARHYIPDWRFLLCDPKASLKLLDQLENELWEATKAYISNRAFRNTVLKGNFTDEELREKVIKSFNFPPSQFQLHVQWLLPPCVPFHHFMAEIRNHFHEGRAFPIKYVRKVLELDQPYPVQKNTPIEDILAYYDAQGVVYREYWQSFYTKAINDSISLANWDPADFKYVVEDGKVYNFQVEGGQVVKGPIANDVNAVDLQNQDKALLQNYGRPLNADGKPSGTYTRLPLNPVLGAGGYESWPGVLSSPTMKARDCMQFFSACSGIDCDRR